MTQPNDPVFPVQPTSYGGAGSVGGYGGGPVYHGLTKRELFAALLLSVRGARVSLGSIDAELAVKQADQLIEALNSHEKTL